MVDESEVGHLKADVSPLVQVFRMGAGHSYTGVSSTNISLKHPSQSNGCTPFFFLFFFDKYMGKLLLLCHVCVRADIFILFALYLRRSFLVLRIFENA